MSMMLRGVDFFKYRGILADVNAVEKTGSTNDIAPLVVNIDTKVSSGFSPAISATTSIPNIRHIYRCMLQEESEFSFQLKPIGRLLSEDIISSLENDLTASGARGLTPARPFMLDLERARHLQDGWAGPRSFAPKPETLADTNEFLALAVAERLPDMMISVSRSGIITLETSAVEEKRLVARIEGDGYVGYALFHDGKFRAADEDIDLTLGAIPASLLEYFQV